MKKYCTQNQLEVASRMTKDGITNFDLILQEKMAMCAKRMCAKRMAYRGEAVDFSEWEKLRRDYHNWLTGDSEEEKSRLARKYVPASDGYE